MASLLTATNSEPVNTKIEEGKEFLSERLEIRSVVIGDGLSRMSPFSPSSSSPKLIQKLVLGLSNLKHLCPHLENCVEKSREIQRV